MGVLDLSPLGVCLRKRPVGDLSDTHDDAQPSHSHYCLRLGFRKHTATQSDRGGPGFLRSFGSFAEKDDSLRTESIYSDHSQIDHTHWRAVRAISPRRAWVGCGVCMVVRLLLQDADEICCR